jgi:sodium/potassium-transporting ATPase subunit alpha
MTQLADSLICKTRFLSLFQVKGRNVIQALGMIIAILVGILFAYLPVFHSVLGTASINPIDWAFTLPFSFFLLFQDEVRKYFIRKNPKGKQR